jgi:hypothetical protein
MSQHEGGDRVVGTQVSVVHVFPHACQSVCQLQRLFDGLASSDARFHGSQGVPNEMHNHLHPRWLGLIRRVLHRLKRMVPRGRTVSPGKATAILAIVVADNTPKLIQEGTNKRRTTTPDTSYQQRAKGDPQHFVEPINWNFETRDHQ